MESFSNVAKSNIVTFAGRLMELKISYEIKQFRVKKMNITYFLSCVNLRLNIYIYIVLGRYEAEREDDRITGYA